GKTVQVPLVVSEKVESSLQVLSRTTTFQLDPAGSHVTWSNLAGADRYMDTVIGLKPLGGTLGEEAKYQTPLDAPFGSAWAEKPCPPPKPVPRT
ncbi:MAG TPA: hypothetical protein VK302_13375, partial [Terriglobales bacterium]|nr:hypothetical protein [Terriglobales bacterium]